MEALVPTENYFKYSLLTQFSPDWLELSMVSPLHSKEDLSKRVDYIAQQKLQLATGDSTFLATDFQFVLPKVEVGVSRSGNMLRSLSLALAGEVLQRYTQNHLGTSFIVEPRIKMPSLKNSLQIREYWRERIDLHGQFAALLIGLAAKKLEKVSTEIVALPFVLAGPEDVVWPAYDENEFRQAAILDDLVPVEQGISHQRCFNLIDPINLKMFMSPLTISIANLLTEVDG